MKIWILLVFMYKLENQWGVEEDNNVLILTSDNFSEFIENNAYVFVKFYAPWCGHCKAMAPEYSKLADSMHKKEDPVPIVKIDATVEKELAEKYDVSGFPALKLFINGEPVDY